MRSLIDVEPHGTLAELDGLADAHAGADERRLEPPHLAPPEVHLAERQLEEVELVLLVLVLFGGHSFPSTILKCENSECQKM